MTLSHLNLISFQFHKFSISYWAGFTPAAQSNLFGVTTSSIVAFMKALQAFLIFLSAFPPFTTDSISSLCSSFYYFIIYILLRRYRSSNFAIFTAGSLWYKATETGPSFYYYLRKGDYKPAVCGCSIVRNSGMFTFGLRDQPYSPVVGEADASLPYSITLGFFYCPIWDETA